jgi:hypothetical protein
VKIPKLALIILLLVSFSLITIGSSTAANPKVTKLYNELMGFKDKADFHQTGFDKINTPYDTWKKKVSALLADPDEKVREASVYLKILGMEYYRTGGSENATTKNSLKILQEHLK